jgi:hypothetical protein
VAVPVRRIADVGAELLLLRLRLIVLAVGHLVAARDQVHAAPPSGGAPGTYVDDR